MPRLLDARSGSYAEVRPARPGLLRVCAHAPGATDGSDVTGLRVLLVADLLARAAELGDLQVLTALAFAGQPSGRVTAFERAADALGIHPPAVRAGSQDAVMAVTAAAAGSAPPIDGSRDAAAGLSSR